MATRKRARSHSTESESETRDEPEVVGSAVEREAYGEEGQPQPIGVNRTDAEGIDSHTQPGAAERISAEAATPHTTPAVTDPKFAVEQAKRDMKKKYGQELPYFLMSYLDVRRGDEVYRYAPGRIVDDIELTEEEFDLAIEHGIIRPATVAEFRSQQRADATAEEKERLAKHRREQIPAKPKKASDKPPKGAQRLSNLAEDAKDLARAKAARDLALSASR